MAWKKVWEFLGYHWHVFLRDQVFRVVIWL